MKHLELPGDINAAYVVLISSSQYAVVYMYVYMCICVQGQQKGETGGV